MTVRLRRPLLALAVLASMCGCSNVAAKPPARAPIDRVPLKAEATKTVVTPTGLRYHIVRSGRPAGAHPRAGDTVVFDYEGKLLDGKVFDSSFASGAPLTGEVGQFVPGFDQALMLMRPGDDWIVWIPPQLGYGDRAGGPIPPGSTLRFRMVLRSVTAGMAPPR